MNAVDFIRLDRPGLIFFGRWLTAAAECGETVDAAKVREAYGLAADYETVTNARIVLAGLAGAA